MSAFFIIEYRIKALKALLSLGNCNNVIIVKETVYLFF